MKRNDLVSAVGTLALVLGIEAALAHSQPLPFGREAGFRERIPDRFLALDLNHDGNITRDELNRAERARFVAAARGGSALTPEAFGVLYLQQSRPRTDGLFRQLDWNGDGKLSLEEYAAPARVRFERFEDVRGGESCSYAQIFRASFVPKGPPRASGRGRFCDDNDLNRDGTVTRAEFDSVTIKRFAFLTGGAKFMTEAQFRADSDARNRSFALRTFRRIDTNGDGSLSFGEFASGDQKLFARLDGNHDGVVGANELSIGGAYRKGQGRT